MMYIKRYEVEERRVVKNSAGEYEMKHSHDWAFWAEGRNRLTVERDGEQKTVKVVHDGEFIVKLMKTQIKAMGGAVQLVKFMVEEFKDSDFSVWAWKVLHWAFDSCKSMSAAVLADYPRYQVVTWCSDCGDDDKTDFDDLGDAIHEANRYRSGYDYAAVYDRANRIAYVVFGNPEQTVFSERVTVSDKFLDYCSN